MVWNLNTGVTLLQQYYELIRLPECHLQYLTVHRLDIDYSFWESILGLPSSHKLRLIPCYGLRPRWTHSTLPCRIALCYIPRLEMLNIGGVIAAFRYTDNVGFQDLRNFHLLASMSLARRARVIRAQDFQLCGSFLPSFTKLLLCWKRILRYWVKCHLIKGGRNDGY